MCTYHCIAVSIVGLSCHYANAVHYKPRCAHKLRCIISFLDPSEDTLSAKRQYRTAVIQPVHAPTQNAVCMHDSEPFEANLRCLDSKLRIPSLGFRGLPNCLNCKTFSGGLPAFASPGPFCSPFFEIRFRVRIFSWNCVPVNFPVIKYSANMQKMINRHRF